MDSLSNETITNYNHIITTLVSSNRALNIKGPIKQVLRSTLFMENVHPPRRNSNTIEFEPYTFVIGFHEKIDTPPLCVTYHLNGPRVITFANISSWACSNSNHYNKTFLIIRFVIITVVDHSFNILITTLI